MLWDELARLHTQLGIEPPTATYSVEALAEEVALAQRASASTTHTPDYFKDAAALQRAAQHAGAVLEDTFGDPIPDGQEAAHRRTHKTWRSYYAPVFFRERPTPELYLSTSSEDDAGIGEAHVSSSSAHARLATQDANAA